MSEAEKAQWVLGMMSGTSLDGVDIALVKTDGEVVYEKGPSASYAYSDETRKRVASVLMEQEETDAVKRAQSLVTYAYCDALSDFLSNGKSIIDKSKIEVIGIHGQTITHIPEIGFTWQIGDPQRIANHAGIPVICDLRLTDIQHGGQGAPLIPVYHKALTHGMEQPIVVVNIGGVSNVTYIDGDSVVAFDCGPGNAFMDDLMEEMTDEHCDFGGETASRGIVMDNFVERFLEDEYHAKLPPKSLDRQSFAFLKKISGRFEDSMATLNRITAEGIKASLNHFPKEPKRWVIVGGGRHNHVLMKNLRNMLPGEIILSSDLDWDGDMVEAEGFAYMAKRSLLGLPISFPETTGIDQPRSGGRLVKPETA